MAEYFAFSSFSDVAQGQLLMYFVPNAVWLQKDLKTSFTINMNSGSLRCCLTATVLSLLTTGFKA